MRLRHSECESMLIIIIKYYIYVCVCTLLCAIYAYFRLKLGLQKVKFTFLLVCSLYKDDNEVFKKRNRKEKERTLRKN